MLTDPVTALTLTDGEMKFYRQEGYLLIPGLMSERAAAELHAEVMELMLAIGGFEGNKLKQSSEYKAGTQISGLVNSPALCNLAGQLMGGPSTLYLPFTAVKGVGGGTFHFHQDNNYTRFDDGMGGINLWIALMPMTPENGCLMVVPRSHAKGTLESEFSPDGDAHKKVKYDPADFLPVRMRRRLHRLQPIDGARLGAEPHADAAGRLCRAISPQRCELYRAGHRREEAADEVSALAEPAG